MMDALSLVVDHYKMQALLASLRAELAAAKQETAKLLMDRDQLEREIALLHSRLSSSAHMRDPIRVYAYLPDNRVGPSDC